MGLLPDQQVRKTLGGTAFLRHGDDQAFTALCSRYLTARRFAMNAFYGHHKDSIRFRYRCFDRRLLNACIQPFLDGARAQGFFFSYRETYPVSRNVLREVAAQFHNWVTNRAQKWCVEIVEAPEGRRD